jgi:hypothetical protein
MTKLFVFSFFVLITASSFFSKPIASSAGCYSSDYVDIASVDDYRIVTMSRENDRVKAKYFAARDFDGKSVYERFNIWKRNNPNVILLSSGTYTDNYFNPQGLTIDNGVVVNQNLIGDKMDALVIVYATGGIAVTDLRQGDLSVNGIQRKLNIRNSPYDLDDFIEWSKEQDATVFQTHLLVYKNEIKVNPANSSREKRERRFLAVGKDENGKIVHMIIHNTVHKTLYEGTKATLDFLRMQRDMENIIFMINLDTGAQDAFVLNNPDCSINSSIRGTIDPSKAVNLLAYYFK